MPYTGHGISEMDTCTLCRYMIAKSINMITIVGLFRADGDSKFGLICDTITMRTFAVPIGFLVTFYFHLLEVSVS